MKRIFVLVTAVWALTLWGCGSSAPGPAMAATATTAGASTQTGGPAMTGELLHTDAEWKKLLTPEQYRVLREKGTDAPYTNRYDRTSQAGTYYCAACGAKLFSSDTKFNSGCGWPAFYAAAAGDAVKLTPDFSHGMTRTEVTCTHCGGHLGHLFSDAPDQPTGQRYCINSTSLKFVPAETQPGTGK